MRMGWREFGKTAFNTKVDLLNLESLREFAVKYPQKFAEEYPELAPNKQYPYGQPVRRMPYTQMTAFRARARGRQPARMLGRVRKQPQKSSKRYSQTKYGFPKSPRHTVGSPVGAGGCKTATVSSNDHWSTITDIQYASHEKNIADLTKLTKGTTEKLNERNRGIVNCRGIALTINVGNLSQVHMQEFHYAIVSPKHSTTVSDTDFFRAYNDTRSQNFLASTLSGMDLMYNPINSDLYNIWSHDKILLRKNMDGLGIYDNREYPGFRTLKKYIKIDRQLRYADGIDNCETPIFLVWWSTDPFKVTTEGTVPTQFQMTYRAVMHFKEPKD